MFTPQHDRSFQRQLSLYNFGRITKGPNKGLRFHNLFKRGNKSAVKALKPLAPPGANATKPKSTQDKKKNKRTTTSATDNIPLPKHAQENEIAANTIASSFTAMSAGTSHQNMMMHTPMLTMQDPAPISTNSYANSNNGIFCNDGTDIGNFEGMNFFLVEDRSSNQMKEPQLQQAVPPSSRIVSPSLVKPVALRPATTFDSVFDESLGKIFENTIGSQSIEQVFVSTPNISSFQPTHNLNHMDRIVSQDDMVTLDPSAIFAA